MQVEEVWTLCQVWKGHEDLHQVEAMLALSGSVSREGQRVTDDQKSLERSHGWSRLRAKNHRGQNFPARQQVRERTQEVSPEKLSWVQVGF